MDINRLSKAQELLKKSESTQKIIDVMKNLTDDYFLTKDVKDFAEALYNIKQDFYMKLIELKSEYDKEFDSL